MNGMTEEAAKNMHHYAGAAMSAAGYVAGRGLFGGLLRNPLVLLAAGVAAGWYIHKHQDEIMLALSKATGMGKDFMLNQKENLEDLMEQAKEQEAQQGKAE